MTHPATTISVQFQREWILRRPYVYRYEKKQWVDQFFDTGRLQISSFHQFSQHKDEARFDGQEGRGMVVHSSQEANQSIGGYMTYGESAYVFCGSAAFSRYIASEFKTDSGFRINDTVAFADAIAHRLSGFVGGCEGPCIYLPKRIVARDMSHVPTSAIHDDAESDKVSLDKMMGFLSTIAGDDPLFLKEARHSYQCEYRFVWHTHIPRVRGVTYVDVPEARQFCTRFENLPIENLPSPSLEQQHQANKS